jgi:Protein of unknown function (DUF4232)
MRGQRLGATFMVGTAILGAFVSGCAAPGQVVQASAASGRIDSPMSSGAPTLTSAAASKAVDETGAVPWVDRLGSIFVGSPLPVAPLPTSGPACQASDLKVSFTGSSGAAGELFFGYDFTNVSSAACILRGYPRVVATWQGKAPLVATDGPTFFGFPMEPETMAPGASTKFVVGTGRDCPLAGGSGSAPPLADPIVTVSIPGSGTVVLPGDVGPLCGLFADQFGVQPVDPEYTKSPIDGATVTLELPSAVKAGGTLRYVVDLTNPTSSDMVLDPCPSYWQWIGVASKATVELNCDAVPVLAAHTTRRFAMELAVPTDVPTGPATVYWNAAAVAVDISARGSLRVVTP